MSSFMPSGDTVLLDTNTVSYIIKGTPPDIRQRLMSVPIDRVVLSVVTQAGLFYGLARKGHPAALTAQIALQDHHG